MSLRRMGTTWRTVRWRCFRGLVGTALLALVGVAALHFRAPSNDTPHDIAYRELQWADLKPSEWDPTRRYGALNFDAMRDGDPRTNQLLLELRATWDNAPTVSALDGAGVKLTGYVVPLEGGKAALKEFLLVPYFGACVHSPPPPANQIVHVVADAPASGLHTMDAVSVTGTLKTVRQASIMGASGYRIDTALIERHERQ